MHGISLPVVVDKAVVVVLKFPNVKFADSEVRVASIIKKIRMACIIKQLLDSVFVISGIIKVSVSVISLSFPPSADNTYLDLDYSGYHKNLIQ